MLTVLGIVYVYIEMYLRSETKRGENVVPMFVLCVVRLLLLVCSFIYCMFCVAEHDCQLRTASVFMLNKA